MRIALVAEDYYPHLGGIPEHVHHLALELNGRGHDAIVITARMGDHHQDAPFVRRVGRSLVTYANGGMARLTAGWRLTEQVARILREFRPDVMHVHGGLSPVLGIVGPWAALRTGVPVVATHHSWFPRSLGYRLFRRTLQRLLDQHAASIAVSSAAIDAMSRYFTTQWDIIPNGVDVDLFHDRGRLPAGSGRRPRLLFLGRLEPRTGLDVVLGAMPAVLAANQDAELVVAGGGPWLNHYRKYAARLGVPVTFLGRVLEQRPALYRSADIYLCPTARASFGVTLLEAMGSGAPIIASDLPAFREVAGDQAILVPAADSEAWAAATNALLADPGRRDLMSHAGRLAALEFAWPKVTDRLLAVYQRVVGTPAPRPAGRKQRRVPAGNRAA